MHEAESEPGSKPFQQLGAYKKLTAFNPCFENNVIVKIVFLSLRLFVKRCEFEISSENISNVYQQQI